MSNLAQFNGCAADAARDTAMGWCHCVNWAIDVASKRPFQSIQQLESYCVERWCNASVSEMEEALAAHPLIGDLELLKKKFSSNDARADKAFAEQGQVLNASDDTLEALARLNSAYKNRHGFIFIVFARDLSAEEMLLALQARICNSTKEEFAQAVAEQTKILQARVATAFEPHA